MAANSAGPDRIGSGLRGRAVLAPRAGRWAARQRRRRHVRVAARPACSAADSVPDLRPAAGASRGWADAALDDRPSAAQASAVPEVQRRIDVPGPAGDRRAGCCGRAADSQGSFRSRGAVGVAADVWRSVGHPALASERRPTGGTARCSGVACSAARDPALLPARLTAAHRPPPQPAPFVSARRGARATTTGARLPSQPTDMEFR